jgi:hypothetical protein
LAQDAGGILAMTEDEKKRLDELLSDIDKIGNDVDIEFDEKTQEQVQVVEYNPFEVKVADGDGFLPTKAEQERLKKIDQKLDTRDLSRILRRTSNTTLSSMSSFADSQQSMRSVSVSSFDSQ